MTTITENLRLLRLCMLVLTMLLCATVATQAIAQDAIKLMPQPDSKLVFVSPQGNDSNPGTSPEQAVMSLARGFALLRDGQPDWLLLERGHAYELTTDTELPTGPSKNAPAVIAAFGKGDAPTLDVGPNHARFGIEQQIKSNTKVRGVHLLGLYPDLYADRPELDEHGWTILEPSEDSRIIYVSSSEGSDQNNGLSPETPLKTIAKGVSYMRNGYPDWLKLKAGDTFDEPIPSWRNKIGKSATEPHVITYYGNGPRPIVTKGFNTFSGGHDADNDRGNLVIRGIYFYARHRDPNSDYYGEDGPRSLGWLDYGKNILFEDCRFRFFQVNFQTGRATKPLSNIKVRRCIITDSYSIDSHSQGIFTYGINDILLEENIFDHNGWNKDIEGAHRTMFNHNIYLMHNTNSKIIRNTFSRGATFAMKLASNKFEGMKNTIVKDNLIIDSISVMTSKGSGSTVDVSHHRNLIIDGNVITEHSNWGFEILGATGVKITNNLFLNQQKSNNTFLWRFWQSNQHDDVRIENNVAWNWKPGAEKLRSEKLPKNAVVKSNWYDISDGRLVDPTRTIGTYVKKHTAYNSWQELRQAMINRPVGTWSQTYSGYAPVNYLKAGFSRTQSTE